MSKFNDISGKTFTKLTVLHATDERRNGSVMWKCRCDCGNEVLVRSTALTIGKTKSCGCSKIERVVKRNISTASHNMRRTPIYECWQSMKQRCLNPASPDYKNYGGRGIRICDEWKDSFKTFLFDMGVRPEGTSIDRIDVNGHYCKENCKWSTNKEQANNKRCSRFFTYKNETKTISEWADAYGIHRPTLFARVNNGWSIHDALNIKVGCANERHKEIM